MGIRKLHHAAYRCNDAKETTEFYTKVLGLKFSHVVRADYVPSTKEFYPYLHIFFEMDDGSCIAFFEVPSQPQMGFDPNTPQWVQHFAMEVEDEATQNQFRQRLEEHGVDYIGPIDHEFVRSIYFFDPNDHRLEITYRCHEEGDLERYAAEAHEQLDEWVQDRASGFTTKKGVLAETA
tara:strand:+ start:255 stop:788 length:534 start_codon:yes stop_codon:yes gene_type:complete